MQDVVLMTLLGGFWKCSTASVRA